MGVTRLKIALLPSSPCGSREGDFQYSADAIEANGAYHYQVDGMVIAITEVEYRQVIRNPREYYFSTALKLRLCIERIRATPRPPADLS